VAWRTNSKGITDYISPNVEAIYGYTPEEIYEKGSGLWIDRVHPEDRPRIEKTYEELFTKGVPFDVEYRIKRKDGKWIWLHDKSSGVYERDGKKYANGIFTDVTQRKEATLAVKELQEYLNLQIERMPIGLIIWDPEFRVTTWNPGAKNIFGFTEQDAMGKHPYDFIVPKEAQTAVDEIWGRLLKGDKTAHSINENTTKDGKTILCSWSNTPLKDANGKVMGVLSMVQDITEKTKVEEALKLTQFSIDTAMDPIMWIDSNGKIIYSNKALSELLGYTPEEISNLSVHDFDINFPKEMWEQMWREIIEKEHDSLETKYKTKTGELIFVEATAHFLDIGEKGFISVFIRNITEQKRVAEELEDRQKALINLLEDIQEEKQISEERARDLLKFQLAVENATDHIVITDPDGKIIYANKAAEKLTGFSRKEMIGKNPNIWGEQMSLEYYKKMWQTIKFDKKPFAGEIINKKKTGKTYEAAVQISPVLDKKGELVFFVGLERDITEQKRVEKSKTEFVSLASHQLQTPLTSVRWNAELILDSDKKEHNLTDKQKGYANDLYKSTVRTIELVNSLLNVSRIELGTINVDPEPTDIKEICISCSDEIQRELLSKNIKFESHYDPSLSKINIDPIFFRMIMSNLLSNAVKYTNPGGSVRLDATKEKDGILIKVTDTGVGIPKKQQDRMYTKFFRADNAQVLSEGSGLGLYIVKSVLDKTGGKIWFESEEGKGTTFYVQIPLTGMKKLKGTKGFSFT
jgi:PAS domain S-box-containing protein